MALRHNGGGGRSFFWQAYDSGALAAGLFAIGSSLAIGLTIGSSQASPATRSTRASSRIRHQQSEPTVYASQAGHDCQVLQRLLSQGTSFRAQ